MSKAPRMLLTTMWQEVGQPVKEESSAQVASVLRMDSEALILETNAQGTIFMGLGMFVMFIIVPAMCSIFIPEILDEIAKPAPSGISQTEMYIVNGVSLLMFSVLIYLSIWMSWLGLIRPAPSPIIFNRKTGKVYGSHRGRALEMDWKQVRPVLTQGVLIAAGAQRFYNLVLFQPESTHDWFHARSKRGIGLIVTAGHAWGWGTCHQLWEFIRRYMDEDPRQAAKRLPAVEITPHSASWISKVLDRGPYYDATPDGDRMQRLRERNGKPEINAINTLYVAFMGPGSLFSLFQAWGRRTVKLPDAWWPQPAKGDNPYQTKPATPEDLLLRKKAARIVAPWLLVTVGGGCLFWFGFAWWVTHLV